MDAVKPNISLAELEENIIAFWRENNIFLRSMDPHAPTSVAQASGDKEASKLRPSYVFYDGPPFATGLPHYGHLLAGTIKDVVGRFFTMKGYHVDRRFGWDCHGVPVEFEIQKKLDLHGAKAIKEFGIDNFNEECRSIVQRYTQEWQKFVERSGRWVDFERQYRTMDLEYMESIWWVLKRLWDRGLVYEGFKCVPYSPGINTPLSNFEANLNYKTVQDPAITIRAPLHIKSKDLPGGESLPTLDVNAYVWTTTPWTLPSNMAIAVGSELDYVAVVIPDKEIVVIGKGTIGEHFPGLCESETKSEGPWIGAEFKGVSLLGLEYTPFFPYFEKEREKNAFRIYKGDEFVTEEDGTGLVHMASFGEEDLTVFLANDITVTDPVDEDGCFDSSVSDFEGLYVKDADPKIIADLKARGLLVSHKTLEHNYPFCWRTDTPLIYKSISSWFVKVEEIKDLLIHSNTQINWVPSHLKEGRFGHWLEGARDWAISRNRFWGTPIPIWRCDKCEKDCCIGSIAELEDKTGEKISDLHSHFIDSLEISCDECGQPMKRIEQVLDCWFESGAMPYAQAHYPFENKQEFEANFPADFIAEGLDQTRGWFYTLLVLSSALFGRPAFKNVVVNGILLAEDGRKMSKSLKNYPPPDKVMNKHGADALRIYMLSSPATRAEELRFSEEGVKQVVRQTLLPLWNAYNFLVTYALVDNWTPDKAPVEESSNHLDRWILSKVGSLVEGVDASLSTYHLYTASQPILEFVDQLTNWYIRLNRRRFWGGNTEEQKRDKHHAYCTLHQALLSFVRVLAPIAPFISEEIFQNLKKNDPSDAFDSVHLAPFPTMEELQSLEIDRELEKTMELFEEVIVLGRTVRNEHNVKLRQPLSSITIIYPNEQELIRLEVLDGYIREELNVKEIIYTHQEEEYVTLNAKLNTIKLGKILGPQLGKDGMKELHSVLRELSTSELREIESGAKSLSFRDLTLAGDDILISRSPKKDRKACASSGQISIQLDTALSTELRLEGLAREFINRVQKLRKDFAFGVADRILIKYMTACPRLESALETHKDFIMSEVLAVDMEAISAEDELALGGSSQHLPSAQEIDDKTIIVSLGRIQS